MHLWQSVSMPQVDLVADSGHSNMVLLVPGCECELQFADSCSSEEWQDTVPQIMLFLKALRTMSHFLHLRTYLHRPGPDLQAASRTLTRPMQRWSHQSSPEPRQASAGIRKFIA